MTTTGRTAYRLRGPARTAMIRAELYGALSRGLMYPTAELVQAAATGRYAAMIADGLWSLGYPAPPDGLAALAGAPDPGQWAAEYLRLFTQGARVPCPLYETEYTGAHVWMQTQEMADIGGFYRAFGVDAEGSGERPDHLGVELEFMHLLCVKEAVALADGDGDAAAVCREAQQKFLGDHLACWTGIVARAAGDHSRLPAFAALTAAADVFVQADAACLGVTPRRTVEGRSTARETV